MMRVSFILGLRILSNLTDAKPDLASDALVHEETVEEGLQEQFLFLDDIWFCL